VSRDEATLPGPEPRAKGGDEPEELDPELLALPAPPKHKRTLTLALLLFTAAASLFMVFALRRDVRYAFTSGTPQDLGDLGKVDAQTLGPLENRYVTAHGMVGVGGGIVFDRLFQSDSFRALPVAGRSDLWVEVRVPLGHENTRWEPPRTFGGRLVRIGDGSGFSGPRHRGIASAIESATGHGVPADAFLLVDGESPSGSLWSGALAVLFVAFAGWNLAGVYRIVRRVR
jgi:hypothetical protein